MVSVMLPDANGITVDPEPPQAETVLFRVRADGHVVCFVFGRPISTLVVKRGRSGEATPMRHHPLFFFLLYLSDPPVCACRRENHPDRWKNPELLWLQ